MVNRVTLVGYLGGDPQLRRLPSGVAVASLRLATSEHYRDRAGEWRERTEWHDVTLWRGLAERAEKQLRAGMLVYVEGRLSSGRYADRAGVEHRTAEVNAERLRILRRPGDVGEGEGQPAEKRPVGISVTPPASGAHPEAPPPADTSEDASELPF